jgi:hypothetical protein
MFTNNEIKFSLFILLFVFHGWSQISIINQFNSNFCAEKKKKKIPGPNLTKVPRHICKNAFTDDPQDHVTGIICLNRILKT